MDFPPANPTVGSVLPSSVAKHPWRFLVLLASVVIILAVSFFILEIPQKPFDPFNSKSLIFSITDTKNRFNELVAESFKTKDKKAAGDFLVKAFFLLKANYEQDPSEEKRNTLMLIKGYIAENFANENKLELIVPCKEEVCGANKVYSDDIKDLKKAIDESKSLGDDYKKSINYSLDNAALGEARGDKKLKYAAFSGVFANLMSALGTEKNQEIADLIAKDLDFMEKIDPERFITEKDLGFFKL